VNTREAAKVLAKHWQAGWARHEADGIAALYADDCVHRSMPFRPRHVGRDRLADYIRSTFADERAVDVRFGNPIVDGDRFAMEYLAALMDRRTKQPVTLAGCAFLRFDGSGLVVESRDYWHTAEGHQDVGSPLFI
jgi:SnoaL-like domain